MAPLACQANHVTRDTPHRRAHSKASISNGTAVGAAAGGVGSVGMIGTPTLAQIQQFGNVALAESYFAVR